MDDYRKAHQDSHQPEIHVMKLDVSLLSQAHCVLVYCVWCGIPSSHAFGDRLRIVIQLCTFCDQATRVAYIKTVVGIALFGICYSLLMVACGRDVLPSTLAMCGSPMETP